MTALALDPEGRALRAALYGRQSKGKLHSIEEQLELGSDHADDVGWEVAAVLSDRVSASRGMAKARDDWAKLITMVQARQVDVIWLWESSRGDRDSTEWNKFLDLCGEAGVLIWIDDEARTYNVREPKDRHDMIVAGAANELESGKIRRRTMRAKNKARRSGALRTVVGGPPPVGFRNGADDWEAEPVVTACLNDIATRIIGGKPLSQAYRAQPPMWTQAHGEKCPPRPISEKMIRAALQSPTTAGLITVSAEDRRPLRQAIRKPPLDRETWDDVQGVFGPRRKSGHPTTDAYVFGPLLRCGKCGNQLTGEPLYYRRHGEVVKITPSYRCKNPHKGIQPHPCRGVSISAPEVNEIIRAAYERWASVSGNYAAAEAEQAGLSQQRIELEADIARWQERMAGVERRLLEEDITRAAVRRPDRRVQPEDRRRAGRARSPRAGGPAPAAGGARLADDGPRPATGSRADSFQDPDRRRPR